MNTKLSDWKKGIIEEGAMDFAILDANSKLDFWKTLEEANKALAKTPKYNHARIYKRGRIEDKRCVVIDLIENRVLVHALNPEMAAHYVCESETNFFYHSVLTDSEITQAINQR